MKKVKSSDVYCDMKYKKEENPHVSHSDNTECLDFCVKGDEIINCENNCQLIFC